MTLKAPHVAVWGIVPAAGMSRRMGFPKQTAMMGGATMVATVVQGMLDAGAAGVVVVTRTELLSALGLPRDKRVATAINDDADSEMLDSIRIGLTGLAKPRRITSAEHGGASIGGRVQSHFSCVAGVGGLVHDARPGDGVMVVPADMPGIASDTYETCIATFRGSPDRIVIAAHSGKRGHPIVFPFSMRTELDNLSDGLRGLPGRFEELVLHVDAADTGTLKDLNTQTDFDTF